MEKKNLEGRKVFLEDQKGKIKLVSWAKLGIRAGPTLMGCGHWALILLWLKFCGPIQAKTSRNNINIKK